jgi:signal transduction histidine kinase
MVWSFLKFLREVFTGEVFKTETTAKRLLYMDFMFIAVSIIDFSLIMAFGFARPVLFVIEIIILAAFLYGRYLLIRDEAELEKQIKDLFDGNYSYKAQLSKNSPYTQSSESLQQLSAQYRKSIDESVKAERMKIDLVTNVSHDLKTPLTSIISYVELLSKEEMSTEAQGYVEILKQKSERLKNIVSDVFELAKTTSGEISVDSEPIDLNKLSYQALGEMEDKIAKSGFEIKKNICEPPVTVVSDGKRIYRITQNLLDNALKYSLKGTRIYYTLEKTDGRAVITVKNIASYEMTFTSEEILERFYRGDKSRTSEGSGLGLSIAQGFALACGGKFDIEIDGDMFKAIVSFPLQSGEKALPEKHTGVYVQPNNAQPPQEKAPEKPSEAVILDKKQ